MHDTEGNEAFDAKTRDQIRRKILHYKKEHRLGIGRLAVRISQAHPREPIIPEKTLQRFLAGIIRTQDMYVGFYKKFTDGLPDPDPIGVLGKAMAEFYVSADPARYGGEFTSVTSYDLEGRDGHDTRFTITSDNMFCRVVERSKHQKSLIFEGVLVCNDQIAIMMLNDQLTKMPKQFLLAFDGKQITARGTEAQFEARAEKQHHQPLLLAVSARLIEAPMTWVYYYGKLERTKESISKLFGPESLADMPNPALPRPGVDDNPFSALTAMSWPPSGEKPKSEPEPADQEANQVTPHLSEFLGAAERGDEAAVKQLLESGAAIDIADAETGLTALHLAVGRNKLDVVKYLVNQGASFIPDRYGRMPTTIAAECEVSEELCDFIAVAEARAEGV